MNRRSLLKTLLLAPLAKLLPKTVEKEPTKLEPNGTSTMIFGANSATTFISDCCTFTDFNDTDTFTLYGFDNEGKAYVINQETQNALWKNKEKRPS